MVVVTAGTPGSTRGGQLLRLIAVLVVGGGLFIMHGLNTSASGGCDNMAMSDTMVGHTAPGVGLLPLPLTLVLAPLLAVSVATEVVTTLFVVHWALVARLQRQYEFFADRYSAERLGGDRVAGYLTGWVQARQPVPRGGRISVWLNEIFATHPTIPQRAAAVRGLPVVRPSFGNAAHFSQR